MVLKRRFFCALILILALGVSRAGAEASGSGRTLPYRPEYVRLHVVAEDDSDAAQTLKYRVRDACLACARELLRDCAGADAAWEAVREGRDALEAAAREELRQNGYAGEAAVRTGVFDFPDRVYGDTVVPAGRYRALRVVIGAGEGRNWWCVLYPSLCCPEEFDPEEPPEFYSAIIEWIRSWFGGKEA